MFTNLNEVIYNIWNTVPLYLSHEGVLFELVKFK
jgi:hypothetical protein